MIGAIYINRAGKRVEIIEINMLGKDEEGNYVNYGRNLKPIGPDGKEIFKECLEDLMERVEWRQK